MDDVYCLYRMKHRKCEGGEGEFHLGERWLKTKNGIETTSKRTRAKMFWTDDRLF
ncbi:hypothetical protein GTCCBUS3UF5_34920 [Geobacillus thermoleovorans CCB_US3_UF5]|uniref:Uncharacterized protein n=1 Tax=Geobacillus thermoleovorans CCB_US3_UF5 TaxID=1111068 RepID=A0ABM5MLT7_GEOTH|nr:hypothetical protein GTCCBUS3UF5_34920 [Geobacillus thermoleovorans CCB_US3_UF5]GAJ57441.1 hypothetical protein B23_0630 [Geobacillus thermoleovorans B23]